MNWVLCNNTRFCAFGQSLKFKHKLPCQISPIVVLNDLFSSIKNNWTRKKIRKERDCKTCSTSWSASLKDGTPQRLIIIERIGAKIYTFFKSYIHQKYIPWVIPYMLVLTVSGFNILQDLSCRQGYSVTGDVCFEEAIGVVSAITPVPGGVGPVTISMLLSNTLDSAKRAYRFTWPLFTS